MKRLVCLVFAALIVFVEWIPAQSQTPQTPLGPPTELFGATDLEGNPVAARFYLTGGGALGKLYGAYRQAYLGWFHESYETDWAGNPILDISDLPMSFVGIGDTQCLPDMEEIYPYPVSLLTDVRWKCWLLALTPALPRSIIGAVAPLSVTTPSGSLVFHDWEVVDPAPGRCRTGNMGIRETFNYVGQWVNPSEGFAEGVEQRLLGYSADQTIVARYRAVYAPVSPDLSPPLITVNTPRDCWEIPRGEVATVSFACRDLGSDIASCTSTPGHEDGAVINTSAYGDFSFDVVATDLSGNTRTRTVRYSVVDVTAPTASPSVPPAPSSGWYNSDVTVTWNWSDNDGGIGLDPDDCPATTVSSGEGSAHVVSATCRDNDGNVATSSVTLAVDKTPPHPDQGIMVLPDPVVQGQSARVIFKLFFDNLSGFGTFEDQLASCDEVVTSVPGTFTVECSNTDRAGNIGTVLLPYTVTPLAETTNPTISIATPAAGASYQRNQSVSASFTCMDEAGGSGIASCVATAAVGAAIDTASLGTKTFTVTATDYAGNTATINTSYQIVDATNPIISIATPAAGAIYQRNQSVSASFTCSDEAGGSGLASCVGTVAPGAAIDTTSLGTKTFAVTATDVAGNTATVNRPYQVIAPPDTTPPTISTATPAAGAIYQRNQSVSASFTCSDEAGGSGIASCVGTVGPGAAINTTSPGTHTFTVTAIDNAGNPTTSSRSYSVIATYTFGGFAQPVDPAPTVNAGKAGKTYPVKFQLFELGVPVSDLAAVSGFTYQATSCDAFNIAAADALEASVSGNTALRYDATTSAFTYNWKTPSTPGCYALLLTLRSNQQFPAYFQLK